MANYVRQSTFVDGDTIYASLLNNEYDQLKDTFDNTSGHTHDGTGTAGGGGPISKLYSNALTFGTNADTDIAITFNANTNDGVLTWMEDEDYFKFSDDVIVDSDEKVLFRDSAIYIHSSTDGQLDLVADTEIQIAATTVDLNGNLDVSGTLTIGSGSTVSDIKDEDNMSSDSATALATQQSIKAYVDAVTASLGTQDLDLQGDSGGALSVGLDTQTLTIAGGTGIDSVGSGQTVTLNINSSVATLTGSQTFADKTLTSPVLNTGISGTAFLDEDDFASDSATKLASQQSIKAYVATQVSIGDITSVVAGDGLTGGATTGAATLNVVGGTGIDANANDIAIDSSVATLTGSQTLQSKTLTSPVINTGVSGTAILDEDNFASDSNTKLATQQSIKAYVDSLSHLSLIDEDDMATDSATRPPSQQSVKAYIDGQAHLSLIDEDDMASDSATRPPSQQSVKAYVTTQVATANELSELTDTNITSAADGALLFYDTGTSKWIDNVVSGDITIADTGVATIAAGAVDNAMLANQAINFGGVSLNLGQSDTTPAFDLTDGTNYPTSSLTGTITNTQLAGSIAASKLAGSIGDSLLSTISTADKVSGAAVQVDGATDGTGITLATTDKLIVDDAGTTKYINASQLTTYMTGQGFSTQDATALAIALG